MDGQVTSATMSSKEPVKLCHKQDYSSTSRHMQLFGCGVWLPKALAEFINQVLALSSLSVTLLRLNVYYLLIHGIKHT
jgi:hypothetical protein